MFKGIFVGAIIIFCLLIFGGPLFYIFVGYPFKVMGYEMKPTLSDGEYILLEKLSYQVSKPKRGDIILFKDPKNPKQNTLGRIVGLPGERVKISGGFVFINENILTEEYISETVFTRGDKFQREGEQIIVPENSYYVLDDNRENFIDSRSFGFIKKESIVGKFWFRLY